MMRGVAPDAVAGLVGLFAVLFFDLAYNRCESFSCQRYAVLTLNDALDSKGIGDRRPGYAVLAELVDDRQGGPDDPGRARALATDRCTGTGLLEAPGVLAELFGIEGHMRAGP